MNVPAGCAFCALLLLSACKVELTPTEYFDHPSAARDVRQVATAEVRDRVLAMGRALSLGSSNEAVAALAPARDVSLVVPDELPGADPVESMRLLLQSLSGKTRPLEPEDVLLATGPAGDVAWFRTRLTPVAMDGAMSEVLMSGVYLRREGTWTLVQAHFSSPTPARSAEEYPAPDEARAGGE